MDKLLHRLVLTEQKEIKFVYIPEEDGLSIKEIMYNNNYLCEHISSGIVKIHRPWWSFLLPPFTKLQLRSFKVKLLLNLGIGQKRIIMNPIGITIDKLEHRLILSDKKYVCVEYMQATLTKTNVKETLNNEETAML